MKINTAGLLLLAGARSLLGWGCEGHQAVALIAEKNLTAHARTEVTEMLKRNPIDAGLVRFCVEGRNDPMADASTWADDVRRTDGTGNWHFMDIPRQVTAGDTGKYCDPVGPPVERGDRKGCVISAIRYNRDQLADEQAPVADRVKALRYLIHFTGDIHQPLHVTDNQNQGGNCAPMTLMDEITISNLHSIWDSGLIGQRFRGKQGGRRETAAQYAESLDRKFRARQADWKGHGVGEGVAEIEAWVWETHEVGTRVVYGALRPPIPLEPVEGRTDCNAESQKVYRLGIHLRRDYLEQASPAIDEQIAKAGFRLAEMLNEIWP